MGDYSILVNEPAFKKKIGCISHRNFDTILIIIVCILFIALIVELVLIYYSLFR